MSCERCGGRNGLTIVHAFGVNFYPCRELECLAASRERAVLRLEAFVKGIGIECGDISRRIG